MNEFNFKSQICTSKEQSERLLVLGLKKETRDVVLKKYIHNDKYCYKPIFEDIEDRLIDCNDLYPAWSLHRLLLLIPKEVDIDGYRFPLRSDALMRLDEEDDMYEYLIGVLERTIKEWYFNKEYLVCQEEKK